MSRKAGSISEETKTRLLKAAADEFSEYGFQKSSLRRICTNAEVTTGALYFFFRDKEDLFISVISPVTDGIYEMMKAHYEHELLSQGPGSAQAEDADLRMGEKFLEFFYQNRTICNIVLNHRTHSAVCTFFDRIAALADRQTLLLLQLDSAKIPPDSVFNECTVHWISHLQIDMVLHILSHDFDEQRAKEQLKIMIRFLRGGFLSLLPE
ncbi:TetR/AcrR family transcriptional regulator [Faecalicatena contorta]|uniref:DNA-binding transcriptional regulator, AcrR family n=1 Tax=Faecalicatena contorta TaxID=39482 RepID=A0A316A2Y7_9FIRM|nr:TetR/AcrR family transcriptional regulator [Faecalicatena contorta]PWJ51074.1 TetR family transcriptional regulator [Faecalicatena contorta]SUQ13642.1 DNA-binding transcriptional regulator, AcrR family [Faecalicatena contorta]